MFKSNVTTRANPKRKLGCRALGIAGFLRGGTVGRLARGRWRREEEKLDQSKLHFTAEWRRARRWADRIRMVYIH